MIEFWNFAKLISYPTLPANADALRYFWFQLPFAVPGIVTLFTGLLLGFCGLYSGFKKENKSLFFNFATACFGYGMLGLVLALRATVQDKSLLLDLNNWLYIGVVLLSPTSYMVIFHLTGQRYRALIWYSRLSWVTVFFAVAASLIGQAFLDEWLIYSFGNYPTSSVWIKPWGVLSSAGYVFLVLPIIVLELRKERNFEKVLMLMGFNLIFLLIFSNLPSFLGYPLFPGANFTFIPMLTIAYAVFRSDFLDLQDLFYKKNGLFYTLNGLLGVTFFAVASAAAFYLSPESYPDAPLLYWNLVPLGSAMGAFALGILVGGANPSSRVNQLGSFSLYLMGFLLMGTISMNLNLNPIIGHRLQQLAFIVFSLSPAVMFRFAFATMEQKPPFIAFFFDAASLFFSALAMSPYLFRGYFRFEFGSQGAAGPVLGAMGFIGLMAICLVVFHWLRTHPESRTPLAKLVILALTLVGILSLLNIPASFGMNFYPGANLFIFPLGLLAYGVLHHGVFSERTQALRVTIRLSSNGLLIIPLFSLLYLPTLSGPPMAIAFHMLLVLTPLFLLFYQMNFILSRPVAEELDNTMARLDHEKNQAQLEGIRAKKSEEDFRKLNEISRQINSKTNLDDILDDVFRYIIAEYNIEALTMQLVDRESQELYTFRTTAPADATEEMIEYTRNLRVPLTENTSMIALAFHKKRPLYLKKLRNSDVFPLDQELMLNMKLKSFLLVPLIIQGEVIAMAMFTSYAKILKLSRKEIHSITGFCDQIAGAIQSSSLLDQVAAEKAKSDKLLHNILPGKIADELKAKGHVEPQVLDHVSVMFTDFKNFTQSAATIQPDALMAELDGIFLKFDEICEHNNIEKLKTIGDAYMAAGGLPEPRETFALDIALAALEIIDVMNKTALVRQEFSGKEFWELRIGIHSGPVIAGVIGKNKFTYDVWGDTVNIAARMESSGVPGRINISHALFLELSEFFACEHRGQLPAKNKGHMDMYFLNGLKPEFSLNRNGYTPNENFKNIYRKIHSNDQNANKPPLPFHIDREGW